MNYEFKGTKGNWERNTKSRIVSAVYCGAKLIHISGGNDEERMANANLIAKAPEMFNMLKEAFNTIQKLKLSILAHPDCTEGSGFEDYASLAQMKEDDIRRLLKSATEL